MEDIIADARLLGKKIAEHPRMKTFMSAAKAVAENEEAQGILKHFQDMTEKLRGLEQNNQPIEPEDKKALIESEAKFAGNDLLKKMISAQADYLEMMKRVNDAMEQSAAVSHGE
ncbi:MAG: YlbF family regulator [Phycisphaerae bacterium]